MVIFDILQDIDILQNKLFLPTEDVFNTRNFSCFENVIVVAEIN